MANEHLVILPAEWYLKVGCSCTYYAMFSTKYLETKKFESPPHCPNTWRAEPRKKTLLALLICARPILFEKGKGVFLSGFPPSPRGGGGAFVGRTIQFRTTTRSARAISHHYEFLIK